MTWTKALLIVIAVGLFALPALPQGNAKAAASKETATTEIVGTVQSFSGNILDIKPFTVQPAVWVTIPQDMKVDRDAVKPGTKVSVEARWATVTYIAVKPPKTISGQKSSQ